MCIRDRYKFLEKDQVLEEAQIADDDYLFVDIKGDDTEFAFESEGHPRVLDQSQIGEYQRPQIVPEPYQIPKFYQNDIVSHTAAVDLKYAFNDPEINRMGYNSMDGTSETALQPWEGSTFMRNNKVENGYEHRIVKGPPIKGRCGLQNLGNTCFMNSALQALSNTKELKEYFLTDQYKSDINLVNPLGTKGQIVNNFHELIKQLWEGSSSFFSPWDLKKTVGDFQPQFKGYSQHDSQEFLNYLLDGIHEDLNRVKNKPYTEVIEGDGTKSDQEVAQQSWNTYLKRNNSIIVDFMQGQFKSQIQCPTCSKISITFDPFLSVSLPILQKGSKKLDFIFVNANTDENPKSEKMRIKFNPITYTVGQLKQQVANSLKKLPSKLIFVLSCDEKVIREPKEDENVYKLKQYSKALKKCCEFYMLEKLETDPKEGQVVVDVLITEKSWGGRKWELCQAQRCYFEKSATQKQLHLRVYQLVRYFFKDNNLIKSEAKRQTQMFDEEYLDTIVKEDVYQLLLRDTDEEIEYYGSGTIVELIQKVSQKKGKIGGMEVEDKGQNNGTYYGEPIKVPDNEKPTFTVEIFIKQIPQHIYTYKLNFGRQIGFTPKELEGEAEDGALSTIEDCLKLFESKEKLEEDNMWYCSKCQDHKQALKQMQIYKAPQTLILHLKRFKGSEFDFNSKSKIKDKISFGTELNLASHVVNHCLPQDWPSQTIVKDSLIYELYGIVNHIGSLGFGHYTAYCKNPETQEWYEFNDSHVDKVRVSQICTENAYLLFYRRK
eukprot:TRINITY_DN1971_c0_g1_i5.p1 TRINITY_DN1971_c0_g1~~TRINITY_DN1971_c0_g1_i5.p1  ORF type:complete len:772 (-),score=46.56 TRINITY_DN1971_c0_g1_i5:32-2347(-)